MMQALNGTERKLRTMSIAIEIQGFKGAKNKPLIIL